MKKQYTVSAVVTVCTSTYTIVEAESEEEALEIAENREDVVAADYNGKNAKSSWVIEDFDGIPQQLSIE